MVHAIPDVALSVGRVGTCRDGAVIAVNRCTVELQPDALRIAFVVVGTVVVLVVVLVVVALVVGFVVKPVVMNRVVVVVFVG